MTDYIKDLNKVEDKIVKLLEEQERPHINIGELLEKAKKAGINKSKTTLRDAIISAGAKKKLKIEAMKPKQLLISVMHRR